MTELNRESICIGEKSIVAFSQAYCEADIIVPDIYPDISKILQINASPAPVEKSCSTDRISIEGRTEIVILYLGDDECVYSISTVQQFSHLMDAKGTKDGMYAEAEINTDNIDFTVLNPRKLNVKVLMGIDANVTEDVVSTVCTAISTDEPLEILDCTLSPYKTASRVCEQLCIRENLQLPAGNPSIEKILCMQACIRNKEYSLSSDKMIVRGTIQISAIYTGDTDGNIHCAQYEIPFAETIGMPNVSEDMNPRLKLCINRIFYKPEADADGDNRCIVLECIITATAKACYKSEITVVKDTYCTKIPMSVAHESAVVTNLVSQNSYQLTAKDTAILDKDSPEFSEILNVTPKAYLANARTEDKQVIIEGIIETDIMYLCDQPTSPINLHRHQQTFSHSFALPEARDGMICDVTMDIIHSSFNISIGNEIDLRFVLQIDTDVLVNEKIESVSSVAIDDTRTYDKRKSYCIKVYFAKEDDNLWSIAKKHRISKNALMEINNISSDTDIFDGKQLMIPIK